MRSYSFDSRFSPYFTILAAILSSSIAATPGPIGVDFNTQFLGCDGQWSTAQIGVGTSPDQWLSLLPNTLDPETWVIGPGGCDGTQTCRSQRGGIFYSNQSGTWQNLNYFDLGYNTLTQTTTIGQYGFDNVSLSNTITASGQSIAIINSTSIWLGQFGLGVQEIQYTDDEQHLSFLSTLVQNQSLIPSHSYGYTAGAHYALKSVPGSLTLGGVDTTRFTANNVGFSLNNLQPIVAVQSIEVTSTASGSVAIPPNWNSNPNSLLADTDAFLATIDSSTPFLWMPRLVCDSFASALNLTYDEGLGLYRFSNNASSQELRDWGLTFTFTLANTPTSSVTVNLPITYNAFDLQLSYPFVALNGSVISSQIDYFPLRRANVTSQYTIGRALLQEMYLAVDYERNAFSLSQAILPDLNVVRPNLVAITRPTDSTWPGPQSSAGGISLSTGAKAGIGVGVALAVILMSMIVLLLFRKSRRSKSEVEKGKTAHKQRILGLFSRQKQKNPQFSVPELLGDKQHPREMQADTSNTRFELDGGGPIEMPAGEVSSTYYEGSQARAGQSTSPNHAQNSVEPGRRGSMSKAMAAAILSGSERSHSPVPPYSPSDIGNTEHRLSDSISPNSATNNSNPFSGSYSSGEQGISPITPFMSSRYMFSDRSSRGLPSPTSPTSSTSQQLTTSEGGTQRHNSTQGSFLAPQDTAPVRTTSRSSRFREELVDEPTRHSVSADDSRPLRPRFSWEQ